MTMYIPGWEEHFEISQSKRVPEGKALSWVAMPTSHQSREYRRILRSENGPSVFGAWCAIVQLAAKMPKRGTLADKSGPLGIDDIADEIGFPCEVVRHAVSVLMSNGINWLDYTGEYEECETLREYSEHAPSTVDDSIPTGQDTTGQDKEDSCATVPATRYTESFEAWWKTYQRSGSSKAEAFKEWKAAKLEGRHEMMIEKTIQYRASVEASKFMKHANRFIKSRTYEAEFFAKDGQAPYNPLSMGCLG
jgi:hypothetical protein